MQAMLYAYTYVCRLLQVFQIMLVTCAIFTYIFCISNSNDLKVYDQAIGKIKLLCKNSSHMHTFKISYQIESCYTYRAYKGKAMTQI